MAQEVSGYPAWLSIDYPDKDLDRVTTFFRPFVAIPILIILALLRDEYPSTDEEQTVHLDIPYPDATKDLSRGLPLVKWILAIPHFIVLSILGIAVGICVIAAWFVILFTRRFPRSIFGFIVGHLRWSIRVVAYALLLTTDRYPPFSFE